MKDVTIQKVFIDGEAMVPTDSDRHPTMFKTLSLLKIESVDAPVYFVVEGVAIFELNEGDEAFQSSQDYFYTEHTCPTNFIGGDVVMMCMDGDDDPHGCFDHVRSIWMTEAYLRARDDPHEDTSKQYLRKMFPEMAP